MYNKQTLNVLVDFLILIIIFWKLCLPKLNTICYPTCTRIECVKIYYLIIVVSS